MKKLKSVGIRKWTAELQTIQFITMPPQQLRHVPQNDAAAFLAPQNILLGLAVLGLLSVVFLAYTVYVVRQENSRWSTLVYQWIRNKKEKADDDLLGTVDILAKKGVDLEGGKRHQFTVEDIYGFQIVTRR